MKRRLTVLLLIPVLVISVIAVRNSGPAVTGTDMADKAAEHLGEGIEDFPDVNFDWCVYFTTYVARELQISSSPNNPERKLFPPVEERTWEACGWAATSCSKQINWFTSNRHGTLYHFGLNEFIDENRNTVLCERDTFIPIPGDLIYINHDNTSREFCHVAVVTGFDPETGDVSYIGGNQEDIDIYCSRVSLRVETLRGTEKIAGFLRPNYDRSSRLF